MANAPSFGKSITILLIGAAVGFTGCATQQPAAPPGPAVDRIVNIQVEQDPATGEDKLTVDHDPVIVRTDRHDRVVWKWISDPREEFTVSISYDHQHDPNTPALPDGFVNPFEKPFDVEAAKLWRSGSNGMINSAASKTEAKGHGWKFTITATNRPDLEPLDPHARFD
jgi:hypothetical protein